LIFTTGGTGFAPRDITPEATSSVIERETPGIAEYLRYKSFQITPHAILSRGIAGICKQSLIINLPGSPKAAKECIEFLIPVLPHAIELILDSPESEKNH
jgi:molybdenum cofactor synthesis domain-containing protein